MKRLRSLVLLSGAFAVPVILVLAGVSAPPEKKGERAGAQERRPIRAAELLERPDSQAAVFFSPGENPQRYAFFHLEFTDPGACQTFTLKGGHALVRFRKWADVLLEAIEEGGKPRLSPEARDSLNQLKNLVWLEWGGVFQVPPPPKVVPSEKIRATKRGEEIVHGGVGNLKGEGVIIAVIDSGIDFHHPDFIRYEDGKPTSRILYFWDTFSANHANGVGKPGPFSFPNKAPIGTLYSRDDLTRELRGEQRRIHDWDDLGHGTACAGIAAGNGNAAGKDDVKKSKHVGVAPEADIIAVRISQGRNMAHGALLCAICDWLESVGAREKKPIVLSCSFGGQHGGRDGSKLEERQLDARFGPDAKDRWCRAICLAAGNDGEYRLHAAVTFDGKNSRQFLKWKGQGQMSLYLDTNDSDDLRLVSVEEPPGPEKPKTKQSKVEQPKPEKPKADQPTPRWKVHSRQLHGITGQAIVVLDLSGDGELSLYSHSGKTRKVDAYIDTGEPVSAEFDDRCAVRGQQIDTPGTAAQAITVGSYDFNDVFDFLGQAMNYYISSRRGDMPMTIGALSAYSNPGPRRQESDGVVKPDIVAPGQYYSAAAVANTKAIRDASGAYRRFNGTSAATPYVAGVVALMLQKNPRLSNAQIKELLARHTRKMDADGKLLERKGWGNGKLDLAAVKRILEAPEP
jgi:subtilisin family serine protease